MDIKSRLKVEEEIGNALVQIILNKGHSIKIDNGCDYDEEPFGPSTDYDEIIKNLRLTDQEHIIVCNKETGRNIGWFFFVYGNDGYDVINDYTTNLEAIHEELQDVPITVKQTLRGYWNNN